MSSYIDIKFINLLSTRLEKFKRKSDFLYNFRCPHCGDSKKSSTKARGFVYRKKSDMFFKCHNCGVGQTLGNLIKFLDKKKFEKCLFIGKHFKKLENKIYNNKISFFKDINQVIDNLDEIIESDYTIFAKGSNSINIRKLISHLKQENL